MISDVRGPILPHPPWRAFSLDRVLQYYDGPRLLLQRSQSKQLYLAWWSDSDESTERWIYLPVSERRLQEILSGEIPSLDGLNAPEDGYLFVVDKDLHTDSITRTVMTDASALQSDALPRQGARLNIPVPDDIADLATRERAHVLNVRMEGKSSDPTGRISAKIAGQLMGNLQSLVDAVGQAKAGEPTSRGGIPDSILDETRLDPISTYAGSFGIRFETNNQDDLFGESLAKESLEGLFNLLDVGYQASELTAHLTELKARVSKNYKDFPEVGWEKWTPKSDKLERRRCQDEEGPARKVYQGIPAGSSEAGIGRESVIARGRASVVLTAIDVGVLGEVRSDVNSGHESFHAASSPA